MPDSRTDSWPPRWLSPVPKGTSRGPFWREFISAYCRITKDSIAGNTGELIELRSWQAQLIDSLLTERDDGRFQYRQALIGMPRKNGKSALGSSVALASLLLGPDGGEVYSCAGDRDQARIVFEMAKRMVELDPELSDKLRVYRDVISDPSTGSIYRVLSAEAYTKEGLNPTFVLFDEVHVQPNDELWNVMALASGSRAEPLMVGITTAGVRTDTLGNDSLCYRLYQHGQKVAAGEVDDPTFFFAWWEPSAGAEADHKDPRVWAECNPGFDDIISAEDFESVLPRTPESEFRTKRTNVFVTGMDTALPFGAWDKRHRPDRTVDAGERVVLAFDGAWNGDCTAIIGCTVDNPHLFAAGLWERPVDASDYHVPVPEVERRIKELCREHNVVEVVCDPYRWQRSMAVLEEEGVPIVEFPVNAARMIPAWKQFYEATVDGTYSHDGDAALARHVENMVLKIDDKGARPVKEHKMSKRHIDLGICAVVAHHRALFFQASSEPFAIWA